MNRQGDPSADAPSAQRPPGPARAVPNRQARLPRALTLTLPGLCGQPHPLQRLDQEKHATGRITPPSTEWRLCGILHNRHTFATLALGAGAHPKQVQEMLGHADVSITLDIYAHVTDDMHRDAAERIGRLLFRDPGVGG
ncbi:MAG: tyrosine-type recombinase/integrase [Acidimicrobiales bacterium]